MNVQDYVSGEHNLYYLVVTIETSRGKTTDIKIDYPDMDSLNKGVFYWNSLFEKSESLHENGGPDMYSSDELIEL